MASIAMMSAATRFPSTTAKVATRRTVARAVITQPLPGAGEDRPMWLPGSKAPAHLDGTLPGDYGFDPWNLGSDPEVLKYFVQAELQHCRWAMIGALGILGSEAMTKMGLINAPEWFVAGEQEYFASPRAILAIQLFLMGWAETRRAMDMANPGSVNSDPIFGEMYSCTGTEVGYPGGRWFDPLGFSSDKKAFDTLRLKEIKNGRLAMVALVGFAAQASATGKGPLDNLLDHIADPAGTTLFQTLYK